MRIRWAFGLVLLLPWLGLGYAQGLSKQVLSLVVPGDQLGWEVKEFKAVLKVEAPSNLEILLYSPGFDPNDYRAPQEFGDERYDKGRGEVLAVFEFRYQGRVIARQMYGVEPHRWHLFYRGRLEPGEYEVATRFFGNGKNAVAIALKVHSGKARLFIPPGMMQTYNIFRGPWQTPFKLQVPEPSPELKVGLYDGDGPRELEFKVDTPRGEIRPPVSESREWTYVPTEEQGRYAFSFHIPKTAVQHTNTVGLEVFLGKIRVEIVDTEGRPVPGASYRIHGHYRRVVELLKPEGWELVDTQIAGGRPAGPGRAVFGMGSGAVRFVLKRLRPPGVLALRAEVACGDYRGPYPHRIRVGDRTVKLPPSGYLELKLREGVYGLFPEAVPGARVEGDARVEVIPGRKTEARFVLSPEVALKLQVEPAEAAAGDRVRVRAEATTAFKGSLPATVSVALPEGLVAEGPTSIQAPLGEGRPVVLEVPVRPERAGRYRIEARLLPCGASASAQLTVAAGAVFRVEKEALTPEVPIGGEVAFRVAVTNVGDRKGAVRLVDPVPPGLTMTPLDERLELGPGERVERIVRARVAEDAGAYVENTARLLRGGEVVAEAKAQVQVLRPEPALSRTLDREALFPGEGVRVCLRVKNTGPAPLAYRLHDTPPDWLAPESEPRFEGRLPPLGEREHCYRARARFGKPTEGTFRARLETPVGDRVNEAPIRRVLLELEKRVEPAKVVLGKTARFAVRVKNPLDRPVRIRLVDAPAEGLGVEGFSRELTLGPKETKAFELEAKPTKTGVFENQVSAFIEGVPAAEPASAALEVLPQLEARRVSTVELPFEVEGGGEALLVRHAVPEGARYRPGSSRLDGVPIPDPRVDEKGRLYWKLPFQKRGTLRYVLEHRKALPRLPEPELTLIAGEQEVYLRGHVTRADYRGAKPLEAKARREGLIRWPLSGSVFRDREGIRVVIQAPYGSPVELLVNGKPVGKEHLGEARYDKEKGTSELHYYGVPLQVGRNVLEARVGNLVDRVEVFRAGRPERLVVVPERLIADGRTPLRLRIESRDAFGLRVGEGFVTVEASPEPAYPDAAPMLSGYQVRMHGGTAQLVLKPMASPGRVRVRVLKDDLAASFEGFARGDKRTLLLAQGSITVHYMEGFHVGGLARGYVEAPLLGGRLQAAADFVASGGEVRPDLEKRGDPNGRFPLTGAGHEATIALSSEDGVAFRYDNGNFSLGYGRLGIATAGLIGMPHASVLAAEYRGPVRVAAFAGLLPREVIEEVIVPDGTRVYRLSRPAKPGSERVFLEQGGRRIRLEPLRDYVLDAANGVLYLSRPLWPEDTDFQSQRLVVYYAPEVAPRDQVGVGASLSYRAGGFHLTLAAASFDLGRTFQGGARLSYRTRGFGLSLDYRYDQRSVLSLLAQGHEGPFALRANLRYDGELSISGRARASAQVGNGRFVAEYTGRSGRNRARAYYEHHLGANLFAGVGGAYLFEEHAWALLGRAGYKDQKLSFSVTHAQPFSVAPETEFRLRYGVDANLALRGELAYRWGAGLEGVLGLDQKLGPANLAIAYQLPGASGEGNRARFGIRAPLPLSPHWSLDLAAGYEHAFSSGERLLGGGVGLRYEAGGFRATLGVEGSTGTEGKKLTLRAGASGQIDRRQVISFDANYQLVPERRGWFSLAYAYRGRAFQVLTYHRYRDGDRTLEGELATAWHPSLAFQLRPSAAYRIFFDDPEGNTYQVGLGLNYYFTRRLGVGAGGYYLFQPGTGASHVAYSVEGSVRVLEPVWLNLGYTVGFDAYEGLLPGSQPGWYLRLDLMEGEQR